MSAAPSRVASRHANYPGDVRHIVGEVKGPNTFGEYLTAVDAVYDPPGGPDPGRLRLHHDARRRGARRRRCVVNRDGAHGDGLPYAPPSSFSLAILRGIQTTQVYGGTVPPATIAKRRAANKVARASRRANRRSAR